MPRLPALIALVAATSLLALQLSGVHMHIDEHGYVGVPEGAHSHNQLAHQHDIDAEKNASHGHEHPEEPDYDGSKDLSIVELSGGASKLVLAFLLLVLVLPILARRCAGIFQILCAPVLSSRRTRWRPPLRAPPQLS